MNHTPRTDAKSSGENHFMGDWVDAQFARQLERELNDIKQLAEIRIDYIRQLEAEKSVAKDHIKRLEKAGDDMYNLLNNCDEAYRWYKAKVPY